MEELTKQQIVLVTLLVSFVTSIATGIVTVALMDQAPPGITQTVNRVVERTIERVVTAPAQQAAAVVTKETIVVKEDDLIVQAVDKNAKSLVSIVGVLGANESSKEIFLGNGLIISKDGSIVTDAAVVEPVLDDAGNAIAESFKAVLPDGTALLISAGSPKNGLIIFKPRVDDKTKLPAFVPAGISANASLKLGQTVVALGGEKISVATGIVSSFAPLTGGDGAASSTPQIIKTTIHGLGKIGGAILVNLSGEVVGIEAAAGGGESSFLPASLIGKL